jgi:isoquinoline 1-oxidoreductase beta subunit
MSTDIRIVSRRGFLGNVFSAGALIVGAQFPLSAATPSAKAASATAWHPNVYLGIDPDGTVILVTHRSEMGTGIRSVLPVVLADELEADWNRVRLEQAVGDVKYGSQNTDGSCSIRDFYDTLRESGATARMMLERAAASKWGAPVGECKAKNHEVVHTSGKKLGYGELAKLASQQTKPAAAELKYKSPAEFRYIGKEMPTVDLADIVVGKGTFGMDAKVPGMVYASIERSPVFAAKLKRYDDGDAKQVKGVSQVVVVDPFKPPHNFQPLGGVAVVADNTWSAMQGRKKLKVEWGTSPHAAFESEAFKREMMATVLKPGEGGAQAGQRGCRVRTCGQDSRGDLLYAVAFARADGAARRDRALAERQGGGLGCDAESAGGAGDCGGLHGDQEGRCHLPCDAAGRRLRA